MERTHEYGNLHVHTWKISSFSFLHSFSFLFFLKTIPDLSHFLPCVFEFSWSVSSKNLSMGTWEHTNIPSRSPPPPHHITNSLGIFCCWGRSLKIQREIKKRGFYVVCNQLNNQPWVKSDHYELWPNILHFSGSPSRLVCTMHGVYKFVMNFFN